MLRIRIRLDPDLFLTCIYILTDLNDKKLFNNFHTNKIIKYFFGKLYQL